MKRHLGILLIVFLVALPLLTTQIKGSAYANQAPIADFTYTPLIPTPDEQITFNASNSCDPDGWITLYSWNFGDGNVTSKTTPLITHSYPIDGNYTIELTVTDNNQAKGVASAVVQVSTVTFFRVCYYGTLIPMSNVTVTVYYKSDSSWIKAPVGSHGLEIKYDRVTQPDLANTDEERYRNPGYTASILLCNASNIGFDLHPASTWTVYFKFQFGSYVAYWPNETTRVYSYQDGLVETHDYLSGHRAYWDSTASAYVIRVKDIPGNGVSPTQSHPIIVGVSCPPSPQKYYLTVKTAPLGITTIPGEGWYNKGTSATLTAPTYVNVSSSNRYRFSYWDVDGTSQGSGVNPITITMNSNHTATAHYTTQYLATFTHTGLTTDAQGTIVTVNGNAKTYTNLPYTLWVDSGSTVTYSYGSAISSSTSGKQYRLGSVTGPSSPITVTGAVTVTGNYITQYSVTFTHTGLDSTATGTIVTVNGAPKIYADLPYSAWFDSGSSVTFSYTATVTSSVSGSQFRLVAIHCPSSPFTVTGPVTITGEYCKQYLVTFAQSGLDSTASGTIVTVNGNAKIYSQLPYTFWVDTGTTVTYSYTSTVSSSVSGKRFRLNSVTGPTSPITVTAPTTVTGNYVTQYLLTFAQTGLDSTATGTVATVDGSAKTYSQLPYTVWADSGSSVTYSYTSYVTSSTGGKRFRLNSVSGPTSPITVTGTATVTGNYVIQYSVTFTHTGLDSTATGTIVTVNGNAKTYADLPYTLWIDSGSSITYSYGTIVPSSTSGKRFRLATVSGPTSPITVTGSTTVTGNYVTQYAVTFTYTGLDSTATGAVVTVNSDTKEFADLPYTAWVDNGSSITYSYGDIVLSTTSGKRFKLVTVTGSASPVTVTTSMTITGNYKTQFQITFDQSGVGSDFTGTVVVIDSVNYNIGGLPAQFWWDQSSGHSFAFASPLIVNATKQYAWSSTSGLSSLQSGTLTITTSGSVAGNYVLQNWITFDHMGVSSDFAGTVVTIDGTPYTVSQLSVSFYWQAGTQHTFAFQSPLLVAANSKQYVWTSTTGLSTLQTGTITVTSYGSVVGHYKTQYYLTLTTNPTGITTPTGAGWYDSGTYASVSTQQYVYGGSRYRFATWTTPDMPEITDPASPSTTILTDKAKTVTANYVHQHLLIFAQTGITSDASGTIVTANGTARTYSNLPYSIWVDTGSTITYSYETTVSSTITGKRFRLDSITGPSSPITVAVDANITGDYKAQYYLTVNSPYGVPSGQGWYDTGTTAYAMLNTGVIDHGNGTRRVFTNWNGDASGTNYAQSSPITMNGAKTAIAQWKTQYYVTFTHSGLDSSALGTVVTINTIPKTFANLPYSVWVDSGFTITYSYSNVSSSITGKRFTLIGVAGPASPMTITGPLSVIGCYKTQYQVTFNQSSIGPDFSGTVVNVDSTGYTVGTLPVSFWWDSSSSHTFAFFSPLTVNVSRQYDWISTTGLSTSQNGSIIITTSGTVTGNYAVHTKHQIVFSQSGVNPDFTGTVVTIDGTAYKVTDLSAGFWWDSGSSHTFSFASPLSVNANKRYVWVSTSGLSTLQSDSITVTVSGTVTGNYKTQYYLTLTTNPPSITSPSGAGWYDANTNATISTVAFIDITPGSSRYRFNGWTTPDMPEIADPTRSPTTVLMDKGKTVTANYATQYAVTFDQSGVGSDFTGPIVIIDGTAFTRANLPASFWWDKDAVHTFAFQSPLVVVANSKQYVWVSTSGLSTLQSDSITVTVSGTVTGNYKTQYYLTVTSPYDSPTPMSDWFDAGTIITSSVTSPAAGPTGTRYVCTGWTGSGSVPPTGTSTTTTFTINAPSTITWNWKTQYYLTVTTDPSAIVTIPGQGWYDASTSVSLNAPTVPNYNFSNWDVDGTTKGAGINPISVTMNLPHTATAHYISAPPPTQLSVTITPLSDTINLGESVQFTSTVSGGTAPYHYQWYLNGNPVSGANSNTWMFAPTAPGVYYVYLKATDANNNTAQSATAKITVLPPSVGGHSISYTKPAAITALIGYSMIMAILCMAICLIRRKRK